LTTRRLFPLTRLDIGVKSPPFIPLPLEGSTPVEQRRSPEADHFRAGCCAPGRKSSPPSLDTIYRVVSPVVPDHLILISLIRQWLTQNSKALRIVAHRTRRKEVTRKWLTRTSETLQSAKRGSRWRESTGEMSRWQALPRATIERASWLSMKGKDRSAGRLPAACSVRSCSDPHPHSLSSLSRGFGAAVLRRGHGHGDEQERRGDDLYLEYRAGRQSDRRRVLLRDD